MKNILVIEDNESDITILKFLLNKLGYNGVFYKDPYDGLDQLNKLVIHAILLDWQLPHMSGIEFLKKVKHSEDHNQIPVVMMSGRNELRDVKMALQQGALDYVIKPIDPLVLQNKLDKVFSHQETWSMVYLPEKFPNKGGSLPLKVELTAINEVGIEFTAPLGLRNYETYEIEFQLLKQIDVPTVPVRLIKIENHENEKTAKYTGSFIGLKEGDLKKIRVFCRTLAAQTHEKEVA